MFKNRQEAGKSLAMAVAERINRYESPRPVRTIVIGLARGGVLVAKEVAAMLCAPLTIMAAKHISSPTEHDVTIAAVSSSGVLVTCDLFDDSIEGLPSYVRQQQMQLAKLSRTLEKHWLSEAKFQPPALTGKRLVVVSDCCIHGMNEMAILRSLKVDHPQTLILAVPVINLPVKYRLEAECRDVIALETPENLSGPMQFYETFPHVEDAQIVEAIQTANRIGTSARA